MNQPARRGLSKLLLINLFFVAVVISGIFFWNQGTSQTFPVKDASIEDTLDRSAELLKKVSSNEPPLLLKSLGINLEAYDPTTKKAGDILFPAKKLGQFDQPFMEYGFHIPSSSASNAKNNPQPTFVVPLGTKVHALVDGVVTDLPKLYSNDFSIMIGTGKTNDQFRYETEHVINPLVKVGDRVKAGQVIAQVSDYDTGNTPGFGLVEIGILKGGNPPQHVCPFAYLDPSIKTKIQQQLLAFYKSFEEFRADTNVYDEAKQTTPGCLTLDPIAG